MPTKAELRCAILARRDREPDRAAKSERIGRRIEELVPYREAAALLFYVGVRSEVETEPLLRRALEAGKRTAVVYVDGDRLGCCWIESAGELAPAPFGLREPPLEVRDRPERRAAPRDADAVVVPGVAFDARGGRVGYGRGYYDRLLRDVRPEALVVALAFECQIVPEVPMGPGDVRIPLIVTESRVYQGGTTR